MHSVSRSLLVAGIVALGGLTACGDKLELVQPTTTPTGKDSSVTSVTVTPNTAQIQVGGSQTFIANVVGGPDLTNRNVTWTSSNTAVATVNATSGVATGVAAGQTTIIATSSANSAVKGAAVLTVAAVQPLSLSFNGIVNNANNPIPTNNVFGQANFQLNVDPGQSGIRSVQVFCLPIAGSGVTDTLFFGTQNIGTATGSQTQQVVTVPVVTNQLNAQGQAAFTNRTCQVAVRGLDAAGGVIAGSTVSGPVLTLNNADLVYGSITTPKQAADPQGLIWNDSTITVTVTPITFARGRSYTNAIVTISGLKTDGTLFTASQTVTPPASGPIVATFISNGTSATAGIASTIPSLTANVQLVDNSGNATANPVNTQASVQTGTPVAAAIRYDNQAPAAPTDFFFASQNTQFPAGASVQGFLGQAAVFPSSITGSSGAAAAGLQGATLPAATTCGYTGAAGTADVTVCDHGGVDKVTASYAYSPTASTTVTSSSFVPFTAISDVPASAVASTYTLRVSTCDALGNCTSIVSTNKFGVDLGTPTATTTNAPTNAQSAQSAAALPGTNGTGSLTLSAIDSAGGAGFSATPVLVSISRIGPNTGTGQTTDCFNVATSAFVALPSSGVCPTGSVGLNYALPTANGQYTVTYRVVDQAGNSTPTTTTSYQIDNVAPTFSGGVQIPAQITSGSSFSGNATDNLDVATGSAFLTYSANAAVPVTPVFVLPAAATPAGTFNGTLERVATVTATTNPFYRAIQSVSQAQANTLVGASTPQSVTLNAADLAGNVGTTGPVAFPAGNLPTAASVDLTGSTFAVNAPTAVCNPTATVTCTGANPTSTQLSADVDVGAIAANNPNPFTGGVCFYYQNAAGQLVLIQGSCSAAPAVTANATNRIYRFSSPVGFDPAAGFGAGGVTIYAVGADANGNAVITQPVTLATNAP